MKRKFSVCSLQTFLIYCSVALSILLNSAQSMSTVPLRTWSRTLSCAPRAVESCNMCVKGDCEFLLDT